MTRRLNTRAGVGAVLASLLVASCAEPPKPAPPAPPPPPPPKAELGRSDLVVVVTVKPGETRASLAQKYLGDPAMTQRVVSLDERATPDGPLRVGEAVAVALKARDPGGTLGPRPTAAIILCYHRFTARPVSSSTLEVTANAFEAQLTYLRDHGYHVVPLRRLEGFLAGREDLPERPVVVTVDDGYRSFIQVAFPILERFKTPATLFAYSKFVGAGDSLSWPQLQTLERSGLVAVEGHSKSHNDLSRRSRGESAAAYQRRIADEIDIRQLARAAAGEEPRHFAYPYGAANTAVLTQMAATPWRLGLTVLRGGNPSWADPLLLRRDMVYGTDTVETFAHRLEAAAEVYPR